MVGLKNGELFDGDKKGETMRLFWHTMIVDNDSHYRWLDFPHERPTQGNTVVLGLDQTGFTEGRKQQITIVNNTITNYVCHTRVSHIKPYNHE